MSCLYKWAKTNFLIIKNGRLVVENFREEKSITVSFIDSIDCAAKSIIAEWEATLIFSSTTLSPGREEKTYLTMSENSGQVPLEMKNT